MSRKLFSEEQIQVLRQNPFVYDVTQTRLLLTKEFKQIFIDEYNKGTSPREILTDHGFDISIIGERRIWSISQRIREEYKKHGAFHEGYRRSCQSESNSVPATEQDELQALRHELDYVKQEIEFLKKISAFKISRK